MTLNSFVKLITVLAVHPLYKIGKNPEAVFIFQNPEYILAQQPGEPAAVLLLTHNQAVFCHQAEHVSLGDDLGVNDCPVVIEQNVLYLTQSFGNSRSPLRL